MRRFRTDPAALDGPAREQGARLEVMARTGRPHVDYRGLAVSEFSAAAWQQARQLFVLHADLAPLMIYAAGLTGRNPETLKELPADHQVLEGKAVALTVTKRRRGKANTHTQVHWSVHADPGRQLAGSGSFYLLLHQLMARSRSLSGTSSLWSIWAGTGKGMARNTETSGHIGPFDSELARKVHLGRWAARHGLVDDDGRPLDMRLTRMKKTVEVRTAKQAGGHLPSVRLTNTAQTSFAHYLRTEPFTVEWAADVLTEAITDAEASARRAVARIGTDDSASVPEPVHAAAEQGRLDTLVASCLDMDHGPSGGRCRESFLTCLRCPNALVLERHLPMLLALLDALQEDLDRRDADIWAARHGATWRAEPSPGSSHAAPAAPSPAPSSTATSRSTSSRATPAPAPPASARKSKPSRPSPEASSSPTWPTGTAHPSPARPLPKPSSGSPPSPPEPSSKAESSPTRPA
ncbi:hypothetical protein [Nonomuraea sp. NPDC050691]|uniref:hypothetical protein n=1 Tax=Nonomuraea sp. NPDC050691 TaxID=3155661 RepID=UPI0033C82DAC